MLSGYADEHVSHANIRSLRIRGTDVTSVAERGGHGAPDDVLLDEALAEERAMRTCDTLRLTIKSVWDFPVMRERGISPSEPERRLTVRETGKIIVIADEILQQ